MAPVLLDLLVEDINAINVNATTLEKLLTSDYLGTRDVAKRANKKILQDYMKGIDLDKAYEGIFELQWHSRLPCSESLHTHQSRALLKSCQWRARRRSNVARARKRATAGGV